MKTTLALVGLVILLGIAGEMDYQDALALERAMQAGQLEVAHQNKEASK